MISPAARRATRVLLVVAAATVWPQGRPALAQGGGAEFVEVIEAVRPWLVKVHAGGGPGSRREGSPPWAQLRVLLPSVTVHSTEVVACEAEAALKAWEALQRPVSCEFMDTPVRDGLAAIAEGCGLSMLFVPRVSDGLVAVACEGVPGVQALRAVCRLSRREFRLRGGLLVVDENVEPAQDEMLADLASCRNVAALSRALAKQLPMDLASAGPVEAARRLQDELGVAVTLTPSACESRRRVSVQTEASTGSEMLRMVLQALALQAALHQGGLLLFDPATEAPSPATGVAAYGTGLIFDSGGYLVTSAHTLQRRRAAQVTFWDGTVADAVVVGASEQDDVAVLKVDRDGLPLALFGDSDGLRVGQWVASVACPFDSTQPAASVGIVSALDRRINRVYRSCILTDAAIFPGSAGGALVDVNGRVVGMIAAVYTVAQGSKGLGCCIPANMLIKTAEALKYGMPIKQNWVGLTVRSVRPADGVRLGMERARGALVVAVKPESPGHKAGLAANDVIVGCGEGQVEDAMAFAAAVEKSEPGRVLGLRYMRGGKVRHGSLLVDVRGK